LIVWFDGDLNISKKVLWPNLGAWLELLKGQECVIHGIKKVDISKLKMGQMQGLNTKKRNWVIRMFHNLIHSHKLGKCKGLNNWMSSIPKWELH
jgi:hypothetical protein